MYQMLREDQIHFVKDVCRKLKEHPNILLYRVGGRPMQQPSQHYIFFEAAATEDQMQRDARARSAGNKLVLKVPFPVDWCDEEEEEEGSLSPEIEAQMKLDSVPHLATGWGFVDIIDVVGYFMRYYEGGDMFTMLLNNKVGYSEILRLLSEVLVGLAELHRRGYVHGNVKAENVLLSSELNGNLEMGDSAYLAGFGNIQPMEADGKVHMKIRKAEVNGEELYVKGRFAQPIMPPELFGDGLEYEYDQSADIWMFGVLCVHALTRKLPFADDDSYEEQVLGLNMSVDLESECPEVSTDLREAILDMLNPDPCRRPSAGMLLASGIFPLLEDEEGDDIPAMMDGLGSSPANLV